MGAGERIIKEIGSRFIADDLVDDGSSRWAELFWEVEWEVNVSQISHLFNEDDIATSGPLIL